MSIKKCFFFLAVLALTAGPVLSQVTHLNDDRDLFIGVGSASRIYPNIVILADSSASMRTVIYHPDYNPRYDYTKEDPTDPNGTANYYTLTGITNVGFGDDPDTGLRMFPAFNDFFICRGTSTSTWVWGARGQFRRTRTQPSYHWEVWKNGSDTFAAGQLLTYDGNGSGLDDHTTIESVADGGTVWELYVDQTQMNGAPDARSDDPYVYANYHQDTHISDTTAKFVETEAECLGADETIPVSLYGFTWAQTGHTYYTDYELNYLYFLAFHASKNIQIPEVTHWAETGSFRNDSNSNPIISGFYREQVMKDVLKEVLNEIWAGDTNYNFGLYRFNADGAGAEQLNNLQNANSGGVENAFRNSIDRIQPMGPNSLAEALADIWVYFKEGQSSTDYAPNSILTHSCDCGSLSGQSGHPEKSCPVKFFCQKNYVIIMTDGSATHDNFGEAKYTGAANNIFLTPVQGPTGWGDKDNHDPAAHGDPQPTTGLTPNPDGTEYCPQASCWSQNLPGWGTDYLDDVAYYLYHNDLYPNDGPTDRFPDFPDVQNIETFTIGFTTKNDLLRDTAINGNEIKEAAYYTSNDYKTLKDNLLGIINNISLRNFGFSSITAPKKLTTTIGEGHSFVGYFMPASESAIWTGHLQSYLLTDKWHVDLDGNDVLEGPPSHTPDEFVNPYSSQSNCQQANPGMTCLRSIELGGGLGPEEGGYIWDAKDEMILPRNIYTNNASAPYTPYKFSLDNIGTLQPLFNLDANVDPLIPLGDAQTIINKLNSKILGDVFHSDIAYIGAPLVGKKYLKNLNPSDCGTTDGVLKINDDRCYEKLMTEQATRTKVVYVGTNEGILHQVDATLGNERWGFVPDEVLRNLKKIVIDNQYNYTVDGRLMAEDIYYRGTTPVWKTILVFGLKDGGNSFYALDTTTVTDQPSILWKFKDDEYSGKSWSKPYIGKIHYNDGTTTYDRWVVVVAGGMAFNNQDNVNTAGKAIFVIDASNGQLVWMIGYNSDTGRDDGSDTYYIDTNTVGVRHLTKKAEFNYPIPSSIVPVDRDADGYLDTIYFGNVAGHLFKTDISSSTPADWKSYLLFKKDPLTNQATTTISSISGNVITVASANGFELHRNVFQPSTGAMGTIDMVNNMQLTVNRISPASFEPNQTIVVPGFDPIFLSPTVFFDNCYNLWVAFGTGDRIRSRTNPDSGKFVALRDGTTVVSGSTVQKTNILLSDLVTLNWTENTTTHIWSLAATNIKVADKWGWQFTLPMAANSEKLFEPEPLVLPDASLVPHIYFNTYQPSPEPRPEDCAAPKNGLMYFYDVACNYCGTGNVTGAMESGRIAGGGVFQGSDYILYEGAGDVASIPPMQDLKPIKLIYTGSLLFWKEKKR